MDCRSSWVIVKAAFRALSKYHISDTHVAATVTPAVIQPITPIFQPPDVALLDGALVPVAVEVEDEVGEAVL